MPEKVIRRVTMTNKEHEIRRGLRNRCWIFAAAIVLIAGAIGNWTWPTWHWSSVLYGLAAWLIGAGSGLEHKISSPLEDAIDEAIHRVTGK